MSIDATKWAWSAPVESASQRVVLLALADRAGEEHTCWPSTVRVQKDNCLDLKTVKATITRLIELGLLADTGARKGSTGRVRVLRLIGVDGREQMNPKTESFQKRNDTEIGSLNEPNFGSLNEPKNGTQNLPKNLPKKLSVKSMCDSPAINEKFDRFWSAYPRRVNRQKALESFAKINPDDQLLDTMLDTIAAWSPTWIAEPQFCPHASTWLNGKRWTDDAPAKPVAAKKAGKWDAIRDLAEGRTPLKTVGGDDNLIDFLGVRHG